MRIAMFVVLILCTVSFAVVACQLHDVEYKHGPYYIFTEE